MWGVFGSRKSLAYTTAYGLLIAVVVMVSFVGFAWANEGSFAKVIQSANLFIIAGALSAIGLFLVARFTGSTTIRNAQSGAARRGIGLRDCGALSFSPVSFSEAGLSGGSIELQP